MTDIIQFLVTAISLGGVYAMLAIGIALVYSVMGFLNFAHGDLLAITGYAVFFGLAAGLPWPIVVVLGILAAGFGSVLMERIAFRPLRNASPDTLMLTSFAVATALHVIFQIGIGARPKPITLPPFLSGAFEVGGVVIGVMQSISLVTAVVSLVVLTLFLKHTMLGMAMRAAASDFTTTRLMGIRANRVISTSFFIAGILAGMAGILIVAQRGSVDPLMALNPLIKALVAAVIGGTGSLLGPVLGGLLLGLLETVFQKILPGEALLFRDPIILSLLVAFLIMRPTGLTGSRQEPTR
ncbi:unnamed protein product [Chrysoparadoxa australica]